MTRIWWVRHGPTHAKTMIGWTDLPADLSNTAQIARVSAHLPDAPVISSDLTRATTTADAIAGPRRRLAHDPALREMHFGAWEDRHFAELEGEDATHLRAFWETPGDIRPPGGESWNDIASRVSTAADALIAVHTEIIAVAHLGAILTQVQRATGKSAYDSFAQKIDNLSVTCLAFDGAWHLEAVNHHP